MCASAIAARVIRRHSFLLKSVRAGAIIKPVMSEKNNEAIAEGMNEARKRPGQPIISWTVMLSCVFLFASSLNCLFLWLSYGRRYDLAGLVLSLILALTVYFTALDSKKVASYQRRLLIATAALMLWAILMPGVMKLAGYQIF